MPTGLLITILAFGPEPPKVFTPPAVQTAKAVPYSQVYARVLSGERIIVASGVDPEPGQVRCDIPGVLGRFECYAETVQVCHGDYCELVTTAKMRRLPVPKVMPEKLK